jgi:hypothetical protein
MTELTGETLYALVQRTWPDPNGPAWQDLDQGTRDEYERAAQAINEQRYLEKETQP